MNPIPPTVDVLGNISVHTRAGVRIPILDQDEAGVPVSLTGKVWFFETPVLRKQLDPDPGNAAGLLLVITPAEAAKLPKADGVPFVVLDENGDERWEGTIRRRGW